MYIDGVKENIHISLEKDLTKRVRAYASAHGISLAAAVSVLLTKGLAGEES